MLRQKLSSLCGWTGVFVFSEDPYRNLFFFSSRRRHTRSVSAFLLNRSSDLTQGKREQFSGFNRTLDAINNVFRKFSAFHDETGRLNVDGMNIISNDGSNKLNRSRKARVSY